MSTMKIQSKLIIQFLLFAEVKYLKGILKVFYQLYRF